MENTETKVFESRAKLMLSGEYLVLKGALSLALPLTFGQKLTVRASEGESSITWHSLVKGSTWFNATIQLPNFRVLETNMIGIAATLCRILRSARELNPAFPESRRDYRVTSEMDFDSAWGIGSGSSLISNIAWWAGCDPFLLNRMVFEGSGYDIACARSSGPILYRFSEREHSFRKAAFHPPFHGNLYFVYLNRKQNTLQSIRETDLASVTSREADAVSALTLEMEKSGDLRSFQSLVNRHEELTGRIIGKTPVKELRFSDFDGSVKSLGSWGGDFVLAASGAPESYIKEYFSSRNLTTILRFGEVVLGHGAPANDLQETVGNDRNLHIINNLA